MTEAPALIFTEDADWHSRRLARAIENRGAGVRILSMNDCGFSTGDTPHGLRIPGFEDRLPRAVFVRIIAKGSLEQITARLGLLHALAAMGVRVVNDASAIERCVDKSMTSFLVRNAGLPTPATWCVEDPAMAQEIVDAAPGETVLKPLFGAQGRGLKRLAPGDPVPPPEAVGGVYYLQELIDCGESRQGGRWRDWRVFVVGGRPLAAMMREGTGWITNIHQGGCAVASSAEGEAGRLAAGAAAAVGADYAGVDLIEDAAGRLLVLEVNSMPAWKGLQATTEIDIAAALAAELLDAALPVAAQ